MLTSIRAWFHSFISLDEEEDLFIFNDMRAFVYGFRAEHIYVSIGRVRRIANVLLMCCECVAKDLASGRVWHASLRTRIPPPPHTHALPDTEKRVIIIITHTYTHTHTPHRTLCNASSTLSTSSSCALGGTMQGFTSPVICRMCSFIRFFVPQNKSPHLVQQ
jgi:hypothetical protein